MRFRVLGGPVALGAGLQRSLLYALLLHPNETVPRARLMEYLWDTPPATAEGILRNQVSRLRRMLDSPDRLTAHRDGYRLLVRPGELDLDAFKGHLDAGEYDAALALWHGGLPGGAHTRRMQAERDVLEAMHGRAQLGALTARLDAGDHAPVAGELQALLTANPFREDFAALLMLARYRGGQQDEALAVFQRTRQTLLNELGVEPGPQLRAMHQRILAGEQGIVPAKAASPPTPPGFVGRARELSGLDGLRARGDVAVVWGGGGIGKTALALRWAGHASGQFPDGCVYVNLHGFGPDHSKVDAYEALGRALAALGVTAHPDLEQRRTQYQARLAGRRVLVIADNARDSTQVKPLLPTVGGCFLLATSRNPLSGLLAGTAGGLLALEPLTQNEAEELLRRRLGPIEITQARRIIEVCGRLPLALTVVAAHALAHPARAVRAIADELADPARRLDALQTDDPEHSVRPVFAWSIAALSDRAAVLFGLLGRHPGPHIRLDTVLSISGGPHADTRRALAELTQGQLLTEDTPGSYHFHDLMRDYAREQSTRDSRAWRRLLDHYVHTAFGAALLLEPHREPIPLAEPAEGVVVTHLASDAEAMTWFEAEYPALLALAGHAWEIAWTLSTFQHRTGRRHDWISTLQAGLLAAQGGSTAEANLHRLLSTALLADDRPGEAMVHARAALERFGALGDRRSEARAHHNMASILLRVGDHPEALHHGHRMLELYRQAGHRPGEMRALNLIAWCHAQLGDTARAIALSREALQHMADDRYAAASTWDTLGFAHRREGDLTESARCYEKAVELYASIGDSYWQAESLRELGGTRLANGDRSGARFAWEQALSLLTAIEHPDAERLRELLRLP